MNSATKWSLIVFLSIVGLVLLYLGSVIAYGSFTDYQPPESETLTIQGEASLTTVPDTLDFLIWNIGYCGLGKDMDFFYDGGEQVRPEETQFLGYLNGVVASTAGFNDYDFLLYQEVDKDSKRSYYKNEMDLLLEKLPNHTSTFGLNYRVEFVPLPFTEPLGQTNGGLGTFSKYAPKEAKRFSFPGNYDFPTSLFMLDRCFMVNRYATASGKELVVINTHNSAYDDGGLKAQQMEFLKKFLLTEYEKGNYLIVGGDWNQCPPNFDPNSFGIGLENAISQINIAPDYLPMDWAWVYDPKVPTNRKLEKPYDPHNTFRTLIDFYLISPNIQALQVSGINMDFANSDHQPVALKIALK